MEEARARLVRFAPYIQTVFPETASANAVIESPLQEIAAMKQKLNEQYHGKIEGRLLLKMDSYLPISDSVKARGGIYEVLHYTE